MRERKGQGKRMEQEERAKGTDEEALKMRQKWGRKQYKAVKMNSEKDRYNTMKMKRKEEDL